MQMRPTSRATAKPASSKVIDPAKIARLVDLAPYKVTPLAVKAPAGFWPFNPSIHFDGTTWRCAVRCADYAMPGGVQIRATNANANRAVSLTAIAELDPATWAIKSTTMLRESDTYPRRAGATHAGFEDMRLFTAGNRLCGIAACLMLGGTDAPKTPEQVLIVFDDRVEQITDVYPMRGIWNSTPQKNWTPFNDTAQPRFLYSIDQGIVFNAYGPISGWPESAPPPVTQPRAASHGGTEVLMRQKTIVVTAGKSGGRHDYVGLRGGSPLTHVPSFVINPEVSDATEAWIGIGHSMQFMHGKKFYWHVFYAVDENGILLARTEPFKLASEGIEFAAGMAIDGDRVVISFGVDDMACRIGETSLAAIMKMFADYDAPADAKTVVPAALPVARISAAPQGPIGAVVDAAHPTKPAANSPVRSVPAPVRTKATPIPPAALTDAQLDAITDPAALRAAYRELRSPGARGPSAFLDAMTAANGHGDPNPAGGVFIGGKPTPTPDR